MSETEAIVAHDVHDSEEPRQVELEKASDDVILENSPLPEKRKSLSKLLKQSLRKGSSRKLVTGGSLNSVRKGSERFRSLKRSDADSDAGIATVIDAVNHKATQQEDLNGMAISPEDLNHTAAQQGDNSEVTGVSKGWFSSIWHQMTHGIGKPKTRRQSSVFSMGNKFDVVLNIQGDLVPASSEALRAYPGSVFAAMADPPPQMNPGVQPEGEDVLAVEEGSHRIEVSRSRASSGKRRSVDSLRRIHSSGDAIVRRGDSSSMSAQSSTGDGAHLKRDSRGNVYIARASPQFHRLLDYIHTGSCEMPKLGSEEWVQLRYDATNFRLEPLLQCMLEKESKLAEWGRDRIRIAMLQMEFQQTKQELEAKQRERKYMYNILIAGVTGTGKSSSLNTILDAQACPVSGAQAQGTRGTTLRDGVIDDTHFMSYVDTQGLGADTSVSDEELMAQIMTSAESIRGMGVINNVLLSFDTAARTTPAHMANQLTLMELFNEVKRSCFLCLTKWNSNAVMAEWNHPLKKWVRKWRRARDIGDIVQDPPGYEVMYEAYCKYLVKSMVNGQDGGAFAKIVTFLLFFEARVVWMFNLEQIQIEDMEDGVLEPYILRMYHYYRNKALDVLRLGSTKISTKDIMFLKGTKDTMLGVAKSLVRTRNRKITQLELVGLQKEKRVEIKHLFLDKLVQVLEMMEECNYENVDGFTQDIARLAGVEREGAYVGCAMQ